MRHVWALILASLSVGATEVRPAIERSLKLLQETSSSWFQKQACVSCHHQTLPVIAFGVARRHGFDLDAARLQTVIKQTFGSYKDLDRSITGSHIADVPSEAYTLMAAHEIGVPKSISTGAYARLIARRQRPDGRWVSIDNRPPQFFSHFTMTAVAVRALQTYSPDELREEAKERIARAGKWLLESTPRDTEDRTFQLLGAYYAESPKDRVDALARTLIDQQKDDGGWAQLPGRASDAYATGEVLFALVSSGSLATSDPVYQKAARYLLTTQKPDGSWQVTTRIHAPAPVSPPYFESGFPHGRDQFISAAATSWAVAALAMSLEAKGPSARLDFKECIPEEAAWMRTVMFGSTDDLKRLLDSGFDVNSATAKGTTALMMASADATKVRLLLDRGAPANAKSKTRFTALMVAASHADPEAVRALLAAGAEVQPPKQEPAMFGATPLMFATFAANGDIASQLIAKGANIRQKMLVTGSFTASPLALAVPLQDIDVVKALVRGGLPINEPPDVEVGLTALSWAVFVNNPEQVRALIDLGANVNHVDKLGYTPLEWAANVDYGDTAVLELLLAAGAKTTHRNKQGLTALAIAQKYGHARHVAALTAKQPIRSAAR